jgi:hypothetical protein
LIEVEAAIAKHTRVIAELDAALAAGDAPDLRRRREAASLRLARAETEWLAAAEDQEQVEAGH